MDVETNNSNTENSIERDRYIYIFNIPTSVADMLTVKTGNAMHVVAKYYNSMQQSIIIVYGILNKFSKK